MCGLICHVFRQKWASFGSKVWKIVKFNLATDHSLFSNSETWKSTRLIWTVSGCKEHRRLAAMQAYITFRLITPFPDFTLFEDETARSLHKQRKRKKELLAYIVAGFNLLGEVGEAPLPPQTLQLPPQNFGLLQTLKWQLSGVEHFSMSMLGVRVYIIWSINVHVVRLIEMLLHIITK